MDPILFCENPDPKIAIIIRESAANKKELIEYYINNSGLPLEYFIAFAVPYTEKDTAPITHIKKVTEKIFPICDSLGIGTLFIADSPFFKGITKAKKVEPNYGYALKSKIDTQVVEYDCIGVPNYKGLFYNPDLAEKIELCTKTLHDHMAGFKFELGSDIIHSAEYPTSINKQIDLLKSLHQYDELVVDVETFGLKVFSAGIGTIGFSWDEHNGIAFPVQYESLGFNPEGVPYKNAAGGYAIKRTMHSVLRNHLHDFFVNYKGKLIFHNANFDVKVLIWNLFMEHPFDRKGLIKGIQAFQNIEDTKIISYLALNSCSRISLKLKELAHEYAGNFAQDDIADITNIIQEELLKYNLTDCLSTWYVYKKYKPKMIADNQQNIYEKIFKPSIFVILQQELIGMPLDIGMVRLAETQLQNEINALYKKLHKNSVIVEFTKFLRKRECFDKNLIWKTKSEPLEYFDYVEFNPGSNPQCRELFYDFLGYPVIDKTKKKQAAVGAKTIAKLKARSTDPEHTELFEILIELAEAEIILSTFIKAFFENSFAYQIGEVKWHFLFGNFNLGGTVSGRLSSSNPNLQNIPSSGTKYAKLIKQCFKAPPGWLFVGADFASLEDRISALTTKDPNKLKVYLDGYDGHCLRAYSYFGDQMPDIVDTVESINSIETKYPQIRQDSKAPTFLLTYGGTYHGLMSNVGLDKETAQSIESNYHELYKVSDQWVQNKIEQAHHDGYVTVAFGLRLRTPILAQTLIGTSSTPYEAQQEGRTAGNALGQSYGMLNNRAAIEFQQRCFNSKFAEDILPVAHIHDAQYFMIKNHIDCIHWFNKNLVECMEWQELPEIQHPEVKLGGEVEIYYPDWSNKLVLPNNATKTQIQQLAKEHKEK